LNAYTQLFGTMPDPFVRADEYGPTGSDTPHRFLARTFFGLGSRIRIGAVIDIRSGAPYSAFDEQMDYVGSRNQGRAFPMVARADLSIEYGFHVRGWRPWVGLRAYNAFNRFRPRDVQANTGAPDFGVFYNNDLPRSLRVSLRLER
jgi:hypothetical protein